MILQQDRLDLSDWVIHFIHDRDESNLPFDDDNLEIARLPYTTDPNANHRYEHWEIRDIERPIESEACALDVLLRILEDGGIRTSWSFREGRNGIRPTVYGPRSACCFTEMPLYALLEYARKRENDTSVTTYGIALRKQQFFVAGGRPVIYGLSGRHSEIPSKHLLPRLLEPDCGVGEHEQYRYVAMSLGGDTQIDWSHEREWRWADVKDECNFPLLPIWLVHDRISFDDIAILVSDSDEQTRVLDKLKEMYDATSDEYCYEYNLSAIDATRVVNLADARPENDKGLILRIEDIPMDKLRAFKVQMPGADFIGRVNSVWHAAREAAALAAKAYRATALRNDAGHIRDVCGFADLVITSSQSDLVLALQALNAVTPLTGIGYEVHGLTDCCKEQALSEKEAAIEAARKVFFEAFPEMQFYCRRILD